MPCAMLSSATSINNTARERIECLRMRRSAVSEVTIYWWRALGGFTCSKVNGSCSALA